MAGASDATKTTDDEIEIAAIMNAVSDASSSKILGSIISRGRSVEEISSETGVPLSTTYRRIHEMAEGGLVFLERVVITKDDNRYAVYRSTYSRVTVSFTSRVFLVTGTLNIILSGDTSRIPEMNRRTCRP